MAYGAGMTDQQVVKNVRDEVGNQKLGYRYAPACKT